MTTEKNKTVGIRFNKEVIEGKNLDIMDMVCLKEGKYAEHWGVMDLHDVIKQIFQ
ncbi:hypothetical protein [Sinomicrobium sp. M5D2P17]